jgi:plastocyanin
VSDPVRGLVGAVAAVALCAACGASADNPGMSAGAAAPSAKSTAAPASAPMDATVEIKDFMFADATTTVAVGGTVTFRQLDDTVHTATAKGAIPFDTGSLAKDATKTVTFDRAGTISYICDIHQYMKGTIEVV